MTKQPLVHGLEPRVLLSNWYVSAAEGENDNDGSLSSPFATIQKAARLARPGDTVFVRAGTYRETVTPARSGAAGKPITYRPYQNETVTVSGADPVAGWSRHDGSIYKAKQSWDLGEGANQVFVDGKMMIEARWPNTSLDVSRPTKATADSIAANAAGVESVATLRDSALTHAKGAWNGAVIHVASGQEWVAQTGRVSDSQPGRLSFSYKQRTGLKSERMETPIDGNPYYLTGKFVALDAPGEWFRDSGGSLYLRSPASDNPATHSVEAKRRKYAFNFSGRSYVNVQGFKLFASTITTDESTHHVTLDAIKADYLAHFTLADTGWAVPEDAGIRLAGSDNVLRNSTLAYSAGNGVFVRGERNRVENNVIHDIAYTAANGLGINVVGYDHLVAGNTVYNSGRNGIMHSHLHRGRVIYNVVHDVLLQTTDGGAIYAWGTDGEGTEVAYNVVYNARGGGFGGVGIYLDNGSSNHVVHHNLAYNVDHGLKMNDPSYNNRVYNNTLDGSQTSVKAGAKRDMAGSDFRNNIFTKSAEIGSGATQSNNVTSGTDARFANRSGRDYRLKEGSPAIDRGTVLPPYTDGYAGSRPDAGAFEFGRSKWTGGATARGPGGDTTAPPAPSGVTVTASAAGVRVDWPDSLARDRAAYHVYAASSRTGSFTRLTSSALRLSEYLDRSAPAGAARYYRVVVLDTTGNASSPSNVVSATRPRDAAAPASAPRNLTAAAPGGAAVNLTWSSLSDAATYRVERMGPGDAGFVEISRGVVPAAYVVEGLRPGATYKFRVRGENSRGVSSKASTVTVATPAVPPVPTGLKARRVSSTRIDISFAAVPTAATYWVERRAEGSSNWVKIRTLASNVTSFSDSNLPSGKRYSYRVQSTGPGGVSAFSGSVKA